MKINTNYSSASEVIAELEKLNYTALFRTEQGKNCLSVANSDLCLLPEDFCIDAVYRFKGETGSGDEIMIIFAVSSARYNLKGIIIDDYRVYSENASEEIVKKLKSRCEDSPDII